MKISFSYKPLVAALMLTVATTYSYADETTDTLKYHRSSIYTILLEHPGYKFGEEIKTEFLNIPLPDKYNNHNLSVRSFMGSRDDDERELIESFLTRGDVAKRMVSKWFNREKESGAFDMSLITDRGYYDANILDVKLADLSARGRAMLADAGEELIQNTFIVVNDIRYIDKEARAQKVKLFLELASIAADAAGSISSGGNSDEYNTGKAIADLADMGASISDMIAGFRVNITSYLYQLEWDDEKELSFYKDYYYDQSNIDPAKKAAYEKDRTFKMKYIGEFSSKSNKIVARGVNSNEEVIRKVCARALDRNFVELSKKFDIFKVKSPIVALEGDTFTSPIGMKEGVSEKSKFEILEVSIDDEGRTRYKRVGTAKPVDGKIWDNRYMAVEEEAEGANLHATTFEITRGKNIYPGMLIREIK